MERAQIGFFVEDGKKDRDVGRGDHAGVRFNGLLRNVFFDDSLHHAASRSFSLIHRLRSSLVRMCFFFELALTLSYSALSTEMVLFLRSSLTLHYFLTVS